MKWIINKNTFSKKEKEYLNSKRGFIVYGALILFIALAVGLMLLSNVMAFGFIFWAVAGIYFISYKTDEIGMDQYFTCFPLMFTFVFLTNCFIFAYKRTARV